MTGVNGGAYLHVDVHVKVHVNVKLEVNVYVYVADLRPWHDELRGRRANRMGGQAAWRSSASNHARKRSTCRGRDLS